MTYFRVGAVVVFSMLLLQGALHPAWAQADSPARSAGASCDRARFRVILDVGHTAEVPGARSARGVPEYEFNLRLAQRIERELIDAGFGNIVVLITEGRARPSLAKRVASANRRPAHLFLSIHHDSVPDSFIEKWEYEGTERRFSDRFKGHSIFVSYDNQDRTGSLLFGGLLGAQLRAGGLQYTPHYTEKFMGRRQRQLVNAAAGVYRYDQLIVLRNTQMPAVLLEAGLIINRDEELLLATREHQARISVAVTDAVEKFCALRLPLRPPALHVAKKIVRPAATRRTASPVWEP